MPGTQYPIDWEGRNQSKFQRDCEKWIELRNKTKNEDGKLCYCGHTDRCDCLDPDLRLFIDSVKRGVLNPNDPNNGWIEEEV